MYIHNLPISTIEEVSPCLRLCIHSTLLDIQRSNHLLNVIGSSFSPKINPNSSSFKGMHRRICLPRKSFNISVARTMSVSNTKEIREHVRKFYVKNADVYMYMSMYVYNVPCSFPRNIIHSLSVSIRTSTFRTFRNVFSSSAPFTPMYEYS